MQYLLTTREYMVYFYKRHETLINFLVKFMVGILIFNIINNIGYYRPEFEPLFKDSLSFPLLLFLGFAFALLPSTLSLTLISVMIVLQVSLSMEAAVFIFLFFVLIIVFYARLAPEYNFLIIATIIGFYFKLPYLVVLLAGMYIGVMSIFPIMIGTFIWNFIPFFENLVFKTESVTELDLAAVGVSFMDMYTRIFEALTTDFGWVFIALVLCVTVMLVYAVSRMTIDYSREISIAVGVLFIIFGFITANMILEDANYPILNVIVFSIISGILAWLIGLFDSVRNYKKSERVIFEDDDNVYYVKVVPKVILTRDEYEKTDEYKSSDERVKVLDASYEPSPATSRSTTRSASSKPSSVSVLDFLKTNKINNAPHEKSKISSFIDSLKLSPKKTKKKPSPHKKDLNKKDLYKKDLHEKDLYEKDLDDELYELGDDDFNKRTEYYRTKPKK